MGGRGAGGDRKSVAGWAGERVCVRGPLNILPTHTQMTPLRKFNLGSPQSLFQSCLVWQTTRRDFQNLLSATAAPKLPDIRHLRWSNTYLKTQSAPPPPPTSQASELQEGAGGVRRPGSGRRGAAKNICGNRVQFRGCKGIRAAVRQQRCELDQSCPIGPLGPPQFLVCRKQPILQNIGPRPRETPVIDRPTGSNTFRKHSKPNYMSKHVNLVSVRPGF